ncbi:hypothetical protein C0J50_10627 [Silurus asotus]|uniref:Uncharacterized protein n=1 Tax=Silurus asotus TaxID=30991 RepID=A0AAD5B5Z7_SILAS|nr:hypothetical protein C0J50_10627 [Silurus asotus]
MEKEVKDLDPMIEKITKEKKEKVFLLQTVQKLKATLAIERKQQEQDINERSQSWTREQKQLEERVAQLEFILEQTTMELQSSLKIHEELEKTVECERESWTEELKKVMEHVVQLEVTLEQTTMELQSFLKILKLNPTYLQTITKLLSSLNLHEEQEKIVERERESWARELKQLQKRVSQLEATLKRKKGKKAKLDMEMRNNLQLKTTRSLQDSLNHSEEKKCANHQRDHLRSGRERLEQRLALLVTTLNFEQNKFEKEIEMIKLDMEEMTTRHFQTIRELQDSLNHCEEKKNYLMRDRERLEERVAQLEVTLEFKQDKFEKENNEGQTRHGGDDHLTAPNHLQNSLIHCEEEKKTAKEERDHLVKN